MNNPTVVELCAGAGGMAIGYERAGFSHSLLLDKNHTACRTLRANRPGWNVVRADITKTPDVFFHQFRAANVLHASTPCQSFSYAGDGKGLDDPRGTIFYDVLRALEAIAPDYLVIENVPGLVTHSRGRTFNHMLGHLKLRGYVATAKVLNAINFRVAQKRKRLFLVARRSDLPDVFQYPKGGGYGLTLRDALQDVPDSEGYEYSEERRKALSYVPPGGNWRDMPDEVARAYMGSDYWTVGSGGGSAMLGYRLAWDKPAPTILCQPNGKRTERCHPDDTRPLRTRENARIQSFPDEWTFTGGTHNQYVQIGNAVPPNMAAALARALAIALGRH